jgi:hypothetical protein
VTDSRPGATLLSQMEMDGIIARAREARREAQAMRIRAAATRREVREMMERVRASRIGDASD